MYQRNMMDIAKTNESKSQKLFKFHPSLENLHAWDLPMGIFNEWSGSSH